MLLLLLLAQVAATPPSSATLLHNPDVRLLFSADDYPSEAVKNHWQGTVQLDLTIGTDGRVTGCSTVQSSGYQLLDDTTCKILEKRAVFKPARNSAGDPVVDHVLTPPIAWRLSP
jgi:protein TonB